MKFVFEETAMAHLLLAQEIRLQKIFAGIKKISIGGCIYLLCFLVQPELYAQSIGSYLYREPFNPTKVIVLDLKEKMINSGDIGNSISVCNVNDQYFCFYNKDIAFAVPIKNIKASKNWEYKGVKYENVGERTIDFLNLSVKAHVIVASINQIRFRYLYSEDQGLLAIEVFHSKTKEKNIYLLSGKYGFANKKLETQTNWGHQKFKNEIGDAQLFDMRIQGHSLFN